MFLFLGMHIFSYGEEGKQYVLVTGGAGYIGSQTCKALAQRGYIPVAYDSLAIGKKEAVKWGPLVVGELSDRAHLDQVMEQYHPIGVIHFAAWTAVGESVTDPSKYYWNNVVGTLILLDAVRDHKIAPFIFSSSAATYGIPETSLIEEFAAQAPINPYGNTKFIVEKMLGDFGRAYGIRYVCFRYFNAAGADPDGELGPNFKSATHLIPIVLQVAAKKKPLLEVFGTDYLTVDGTAIRDYIHVADLAAAHVLALDYLLEGKKSLSLNLGTGRGYSVKEVIQAAKNVTKCDIPFVYSGRREGDPPMLVANARKAQELLGWETRYSDLETLIQTSWDWMQKD
jgi:UDP-glucose-4-epimerase GalE